MKQIKATIIFICLAHLTFAQDFGGVKKGSAIGFSANAVDFIGSPSDKGQIDPGFSVMYWQGLTPHFDFSLRYNGLFTNYSKKPKVTNHFTNEFEGSLHARILTNDNLANPFFTAGIGIGSYGKNTWVPYVPLGGGVQINMFNDGYLFVQANYRASLKQANLDDNMFYSLGFTQNIRSTHPPVAPVAPLPVMPVVSDRDNDGVIDSEDACPDVAGPAALKGCPDTDGDGIIDKDDKCSTVAGLAKYQGCPIPDTDGDGVNDEVDKCPNVAGVSRYEGCPIPDTDGDGVNDELDKCPNRPGLADNFGCPVIGIKSYEIVFKSGSALLLPAGKLRLDSVVTYLKTNTDVAVTVDGYTDNSGSDKINNPLSLKRAEATKAYMVSKGIDAARMTTAGFGSTQPIEDNKTAEGRKKNRRIEIKIKQ